MGRIFITCANFLTYKGGCIPCLCLPGSAAPVHTVFKDYFRALLKDLVRLSFLAENNLLCKGLCTFPLKVAARRQYFIKVFFLPAPKRKTVTLSYITTYLHNYIYITRSFDTVMCLLMILIRFLFLNLTPGCWQLKSNFPLIWS